MRIKKIHPEKLVKILKENENYVLFKDSKNIKKNVHNSFFKDELNLLKEIADYATVNPSTTALYSQFRGPDTTGDEASYNLVYFEHRRKLNALFITYISTEDEKYLVAIQDEIWTILNEYCWALPTALQGYGLTPGGWKGISQETYLDLTSCETIFTLCEMDYLIGDKFEPLVRHRISQEVKRHGIDLYAKNSTPFIWELGGTNWASVCSGSMGCSAMYTIKDSEELAPYILRVIDSMESFINAYDNDGACIEGVAYWGYGFSNYIFFAEMLKERTNGEIDLMDNEFIHQVALFQQRCIIKGDKAINFSDSPGFYAYRIGMLHKLKEIFDDVIIPPHENRMEFGIDSCYRFPGFIRDYAWYNDSYLNEAKEELCEGFFFKEAEIYLKRNGSVFFATIGGNNSFSHNHNDMGHFIYYVDDIPFFIDMGQPVYCKKYFSEERYSFINASAKGHSLPIIDGVCQTEGENHITKNFTVIENEISYVSMDLTNGYECKLLKNYIREFKFDKAGSLTLTDIFDLTDTCNITEQFVVNSEIEPIIDNNIVTLENKGQKVTITFDTNIEFLNLEKIPKETVNKRPLEGMYFIRFKVKNIVLKDNRAKFIIKNV